MVYCHDTKNYSGVRELHESICAGVALTSALEAKHPKEVEKALEKVLKNSYEKAKHYSSNAYSFAKFYEEATSYRPTRRQ